MQKILSYLDEKSLRWIKLYKKYLVISTGLLLLFGLIAGISDAGAGTFDLLYSVDNLLAVLFWLLMMAVIAAIRLLYGMLLINFLRNVQTIRVKCEKLASEKKTEEAVK